MSASDTETARTRAPRPPVLRGQAPVVAAVAVGGALGATARYALSLWWPLQPGGFPWATFWTNVTGCAVIGVFMVVITDVWAAHRLVRPFFGTGVLGGFTTFSTYAVDIQKLVDSGHPGAGLAYLTATLLAALTAVWLAATATRRVLKWRQS
ncbi:fluoride efflux transporter CrcB [Streptomyces sp. P17]|uniref:fluoride efflux transporter CrcB n=1 Tax=Streptomyces sp. P17 TaxID=3074716 RepID=UPI0028F40E4A|nr:fluoride efflux transporter CrcB [Streptomyces sp. P17]MDT9699915.1 fluoride efflux transporter CrcB [Streptomyces sp. P17]